MDGIKAAGTASGAQVSSAVQACQSAVTNRLDALQQRVAQSEDALSMWSAAASSRLDATKAQLAELLVQHVEATQADKTGSQAHLAAAQEMLAEQKASLEAMAADLKTQRSLQDQMSGALASMSDLCVSTASAHVEDARGHAQALLEALDAQRTGQLDACVIEILDKARVMAAENARSLDELAAAQKASLAKALEQQTAGTINEAHSASIEQARALVESACADHGRQLQAQRQQLTDARDEQCSGNAQAANTAAVQELRSALSEKLDVERAMLQRQKAGLDKAADDLEAEKQDEAQLIKTLTDERQHLHDIVAAQTAALSAQAQLLEAQKKELAAALAAQKNGQQQMVKAVTASLEQMLLGQVSQLASTLEHDVCSLVGIADQMSEHNAGVQTQAEQLDDRSLQMQEQASAQVRAWGAAAASVQVHVREMSAVSSELSGEVEAVSTAVAEATDALEAQADAWGKSNKVVEQALVELISKNDAVAADIGGMQTALDDNAKMLQDETEQWRASNDDVACKIRSIVSENEGMADGMAAGAAAVDAVQVDTMEQVKAWGKSDRNCQAGMQAVVDGATSLADRMEADQQALHAQQTASSKQLGELITMLQDTQTGVEAHAACNLALHGRSEDLASHVDSAAGGAVKRIEAILKLQSHEISEATSSVSAMMAPRPEYLAAVSSDGEQLLSGMAAAVTQTAELVRAHDARLEAATAEALASCESTKKAHLEVLDKLDTDAASLGRKAVDSAQLTKEAMSEGPASCTAGTAALAAELASLEQAQGGGSKQLSVLVESYCADVARADEAVPPVPVLDSFETGVAFSSTPCDEEVLSTFRPAVDMSDISSPEQQVMPTVASTLACASSSAPTSLAAPCPAQAQDSGHLCAQAELLEAVDGVGCRLLTGCC